MELHAVPSRLRARIMIAVLAVAVVLALGGSFTPAQASAPDWESPATVAAQYVKSVQPSMKLTVDQLTRIIIDLRANRGVIPMDQISQVGGGKGMSVPALSSLSYWNSTYWFNHWDVAMMFGLSAAAIVALLLTTGPIGVGTAWAIVGTIMGIITTAFFSGYCAYYVVPQRRGGIYHC